MPRSPDKVKCKAATPDRQVCFLSQPFFVAEQFTGIKGKYVKIEDTVRGIKEVIEGKHDHLPEQAFYMVGGIEEVIEKAKEMQKK